MKRFEPEWLRGSKIGEVLHQADLIIMMIITTTANNNNNNATHVLSIYIYIHTQNKTSIMNMQQQTML